MAEQFARGEPTLVLPFADIALALPRIGLFGVAVNLLVYHLEFGWSFYLSSLALFLDTNRDSSDDYLYDGVYDLQDDNFVNVLSNIALTPANSWYPYVQAVAEDDATHLAVLRMIGNPGPLAADLVTSTAQLLAYLAKRNKECGLWKWNRITGRLSRSA